MAVQAVLASMRQYVWNDAIAEVKNTAQNERYVSCIFANQ